MINNYICVPIHTLTGELIALDLTQIEQQPARNNASADQEPETRLLNQLLTIEQYADYFRQHGLLCCLTINFQLARAVVESAFIQRILGHLPFVRLKLSEDFPNLHDGPNNPMLRALTDQLNILWLDDLGAGDANLNALQSKMFEAVKLDRQFYLDNVSKPFFNILIANIRQYTNRVIVEGVQCEIQLEKLAASKIWAVQGYYLPIMALGDMDAGLH
ncbi:EAL domain-containing protein [Pantoea sp. BAV 3049]|uniref:EAL domain-containing protein n=1 Tax=Pantoea sp. BAV 3049 TaxID=2654188 RepID=UPI00131AA707|nr:EAL domain-containing protein [Pantoea sp. BAV 3049]